MLGRTDHGLDDAAAIDAIRHAAARGIAWFDTAPLYGAHLSEIRLGAALATIVPPPLVSTKIGFDFISPPGRVVAATAQASAADSASLNLSKAISTRIAKNSGSTAPPRPCQRTSEE